MTRDRHLSHSLIALRPRGEGHFFCVTTLAKFFFYEFLQVSCNSRTFAGMKPAQIIHQYIWIINTLKVHRALTLDELDRKWRKDGVTELRDRG